MTATPHNGKEEDFQLFLSLLDSDRFYGKFRDGVHKVDASDLMRRMVKEELVKFDGTPLFPERKAYTVNYKLSDAEAALYEAVTEYVKTEMGKADQLDGPRKGSVGFALTALQRRLASSPEAIYQSLKRRKERLERRLREEKLGDRGSSCPRRDARRRPRGRRRPECRGAGEPRRDARRSRRPPPRPSPNWRPRSSSSRASNSRPRPSSPRARTASGRSSRRSSRTTRRCTTPPAGSARSSSSPSTATR